LLLLEQLDAIVDALPEPALLVSTKGDVAAANRAARKAFGLEAGTPSTLTSLVTAPTDLTDYLRLCARSKEPLPGMVRVQREGAEPASYACHAGLLSRAEEGRPALVLLRLTPRDGRDPFVQLNQTIAQLTEEIRRRREAERRLRASHEERAQRSEERFRLLVESVKEYAIFMLDPAGKVSSWNAGAQRIKGYDASQIVGQHFSAFYPPEDVAAGKCERELVLAAKEGWVEDEGWRLRQDGSRFWANVTITALRDPDGTLIGFAKVTRDLTERRAAEESLRALAAEKAVLAEKARTQEFQERFVAILGHDLRNPLASIDMGIGLLGQVATANADTVGKRVTDRMTSSSRRMSRMIEQILDLTRSRLEGGLPVSPAAMDLRVTLAEIVDELRSAYPERTVRLDAPSLPGTGDPDRLAQVFSNLVGNALQHGSVETPVTVRAMLQDAAIVVEVHNRGRPIEGGLETEIFNPFRRGDRESRTSQTEGLGLGLYISSEIVRAHGGTIALTSRAADGTTFRVTLPRPEDRRPKG
jgi:PAS domain S-box-containing protein